MTTKADLHRLIDELPDSAVADVAKRLAPFRGRLARALYAAPPDDEPETVEERAAVAEAEKAIARGEVISDEELARELGL